MPTDTDSELENGLRILARMIARAYLRDKNTTQNASSAVSTSDKETADETVLDK